jgi:hypothetical protein
MPECNVKGNIRKRIHFLQKPFPGKSFPYGHPGGAMVCKLFVYHTVGDIG